jgi:cystathionine beta-lyase/cystathionine gamma-synthase
MSETPRSDRPDDLCARPEFVDPGVTRPITPPIYLAAVYQCDDPTQAESMLAGEQHGYVYSRDKHPNADVLAEKCRALHGADHAMICGSGMSAITAGALALVAAGEHVVVSDQIYGRTLQLFLQELARYGVATTMVDTCDLSAVRAAMRPNTKLMVVETITNPLLRVGDIASLADICRQSKTVLMVDNTFAGPTICRPLELGADLVVESLTKIMNGHSDVLLGMICGKTAVWPRVPTVSTIWGFSASPFDCWLAARGLGTLALRIERASTNAQTAAEFLAGRPEVEKVFYPGLASHPDHALAKRLFGDRFSHMVTFQLRGGRASAESFIHRAKQIPFCPSLGDLSTTLSHPESTSHRTMTAERRAALGITGGTIRLSVGIESPAAVVEALAEGLRTT